MTKAIQNPDEDVLKHVRYFYGRYINESSEQIKFKRKKSPGEGTIHTRLSINA